MVPLSPKSRNPRALRWSPQVQAECLGSRLGFRGQGLELRIIDLRFRVQDVEFGEWVS